MPFAVGSLPEVDAHNTDSRAEMHVEEVKLPATFVGTIAVPGQVDSYAFDGRAGRRACLPSDGSALGLKARIAVGLTE